MNPTISTVISNLSKLIKDSLEVIDKKIVKRNRKLNAGKTILYMSNVVKNNLSYDCAGNTYVENNMSVSGKAIKNRRDQIDENDLLNLSNNLNTFVYNYINTDPLNKLKPKIFAVDGSKMNLPIDIKKEKYRTSKNETFCVGSITTLYDVVNNIAISSELTNNENERQSFIEHNLKYVKENDILIFDAGYYSHHLVQTLNKKQIKYIFRLPCNLNIVKNMCFSDDKIQYVDECKLRTVKYKINGSVYYMATNLYDNNTYTVDVIKELYHMRWQIEVFYMFLKHKYNFNYVHSRKEANIRKELYINLIIMSISRLLEIMAIRNYHLGSAEKFRINHTNSSNMVTTTVLKYLLLDDNKCNLILTINEVIKRINKTGCYINNKRNNKHICINPIFVSYHRKFNSNDEIKEAPNISNTSVKISSNETIYFD